MNEFRYAGIETFDINNGTGFGVTLFVQGCSHHCKGCHNPTTWDFNGGESLDPVTLSKLFSTLQDPNIKRLTISGGEPFDNICLVNAICKRVKTEAPDISIWIYTGYTFEDIIQNDERKSILKYCDVLVDGEFVLERRDLSLPFRGSSNQRVIDIPTTLQSGTITKRKFIGDGNDASKEH